MKNLRSNNEALKRNLSNLEDRSNREIEKYQNEVLQWPALSYLITMAKMMSLSLNSQLKKRRFSARCLSFFNNSSAMELRTLRPKTPRHQETYWPLRPLQ